MTAKQGLCLVFSFSVIVAPLFLVPGCKPSAQKVAAREALLTQEIEALFSRVQELQAASQMREAVELIDTGLANPKYQAQRARFFAHKIDLLLAQSDDKTARELVLEAWRREPALAREVFGRIQAYYQQSSRHAEIRAWSKSLLALGADFPQDLRKQTLSWQLSAAVATSDSEGTQASLDDLIVALQPEEAADIILAALGPLADGSQHALASTLIRHLEDKKLASPLYRELCVTLTMRCTLAAKDWPNLTPAFTACVALLPDAPLHKLSRTVFSALQKNGQADLLERASKQVIDSATEKTNTVNYAARIWVESGVAASKKVLPERLDQLLRANVSPVQVGNLFDRYFYDMVNDLEIIRGLCALGERILAVCEDPNTVNTIKVKILDGAFITDNFDLAVHMLEQGIPGKDKTWHDMSLPKVKAHRAMAQKKPREAVQYFRDFMNAWIASDQKEEFDPTSGIAYSREWILGRNANRIAGILDAIPDKAEADKARAEAKAYFKTALEKAANDAEALKLLKEETKDMGL